MGSKTCFVPSCSNNSSDNPDLLFVPIQERLRQEWCRQVNAEYFKNYLQFCCEDHLNQEDITNYYKCKLMNEQPKIAPTAQLRRIPLAEANKKRSVLCELLLQREGTPSAKSKKQQLDENTLPSTSASTLRFKNEKISNSSSGNEFKVFCPKCNTEIQHTAEGIQEDQTKILIAKVYHYFECEYEEMKKLYGDLDLTPLSKFRQRTALATGVNETTVLQILKEEERRNAEKRQEETRKRARKRFIKTESESSSGEESSDDNVGHGGQPSYEQHAQNEADVETLVVKLEPECDKDQVETNPISVPVKTEPPDDDVNYINETLALTEPAATKRKGRKIPRRSDVTSKRQHTQGESSTSAAPSRDLLMEVLDQSGLLGETEVKEEQIEIGEDGFS